jgi:hypothetical protein
MKCDKRAINTNAELKKRLPTLATLKNAFQHYGALKKGARSQKFANMR